MVNNVSIFLSFKYQSNDRNVQYTNWVKNSTEDEPNNDGNCVIHSYGFWSDEDCSNSYEVICEELSPSEIENTVTCSSDADWFKIKDRCFYISTIKKNYEDAKDDCISKGGRLFEPKSYHANKMIYENVQDNQNIPYWIGINDIDNPGMYDAVFYFNP